MGRRLDNFQFEATYYPLAAFSCGFFLYFFKYASPKLSSKFCPTYNLLSKEQKVDWNNRMGSTLHSLMVSFVCAYTMVMDDEITEEPIWWDSPVVRSSCAIVAGYMTSDVIVMSLHYNEIGDVFYYLHHGSAIYAYYYVMSFGVLPYFANYRLMAEFSTPFVNQRWFLLHCGYDKSSSLVAANGAALALTFFSARVATLPSYWSTVYSVYNTEPFNRLGHIQLGLIIPCLVLDAMNLYWFYKIFLGACKLFGPLPAVKDLNIADKPAAAVSYVAGNIGKPVTFVKNNIIGKPVSFARENMPDMHAYMPDVHAYMPDVHAYMPDVHACMPDVHAYMPDMHAYVPDKCRGLFSSRQTRAPDTIRRHID